MNRTETGAKIVRNTTMLYGLATMVSGKVIVWFDGQNTGVKILLQNTNIGASQISLGEDACISAGQIGRFTDYPCNVHKKTVIVVKNAHV